MKSDKELTQAERGAKLAPLESSIRQTSQLCTGYFRSAAEWGKLPPLSVPLRGVGCRERRGHHILRVKAPIFKYEKKKKCISRHVVRRNTTSLLETPDFNYGVPEPATLPRREVCHGDTPRWRASREARRAESSVRQTSHVSGGSFRTAAAAPTPPSSGRSGVLPCENEPAL